SGYVDPQTCVVDSARRGRKIRIESESRLSPSAYQTSERGFDLEMNPLWGSEPGTYVTLHPRVGPAE
ncbi:MAG: CpcT/CpeT family chromophore lyase, partial [Pseudomonadota bacterium]